MLLVAPLSTKQVRTEPRAADLITMFTKPATHMLTFPLTLAFTNHLKSESTNSLP
jgi:hypothetical protein